MKNETIGDFEEVQCAFIIEYEQSVERLWGDVVARLKCCRPSGMPRKRWHLFIDDCCTFLETWATSAAALGWKPFDLFGLDIDEPASRNVSPLMWRVAGGQLLFLSRDTALIEMVGGRRCIYRRQR